MPQAIVRYKEYLTSCYSRDSVSRDNKLSIAPCSEFINLVLVDKKNLPIGVTSFPKMEYLHLNLH